MNATKISLIVLLLSLGAEARLVEGLEPSKKDQVVQSGGAPEASSGGRWEQVKAKVKGWWSGWNSPAPSRTPASEEAQPAPVAAVPVEQPARPPVEQEATPDNWAATPTIVAVPKPEPVAPKHKDSTERIRDVAKSVEGKAITRQVKAPKAGASGLQRTKAGVPTFSLFETKREKSKKGAKEVKIPVTNIPLLDIGSEESLVADEFAIDQIALTKIEKKKFEPLKTPAALTEKEFRQILGAAIATVKGAEKVKISALDDDQKVTPEKVEKVEYKMLTEKDIAEVATRPLSEEEMKFLRALILYEQKDKCHVASGLLYDLAESKTYQSAANFYLGICLHKMGLFSESVDRLIKAIEAGDPEYLNRGFETLASDLPPEFEVKVGKVLSGALGKATVDKESRVRAHYIIAKGALKRDDYGAAHDNADKIPQDHKLYRHGQYIMAVAEYATGQGATSLSRLEKLKGLLEKKPDEDLAALVAINLGRVAFQEKKFKDAVKHFLGISKGHPLWIQALTEQAWAQLMGGDNEGAIGNMHSVQSPFFNSVYKPETYVIRTIGYLNLCQYPDAYRSLSRLEKEYRPWLVKMQSFAKSSKAPKDYYVAMAKYLGSSASQTEVGGLPFQVLREMGRHRDYLNLQETINHRIDEHEQYGFLKALIKKDIEKAKWLKSQAQARVAALDAKIKGSKKDEKLLKDLNQFKQDRANELALIEYYNFELSVFDEGRISLAKFETKAKSKLAKLKEDLIEKAGDVLKKRLVRMTKELESFFDNNEFLRYEVFAGSGENIRHDLAGGEKRVPAAAKPTNKDLSWGFDGEYWEDEIGHYKSSLKDNCPKNQAQR
ncbi:MAG TPA: hypothetical protein VFV50_00975 [Bdellovibrionales bacterium]|nr:hypothetical protein [Bdellovibrionales bacterium]